MWRVRRRDFVATLVCVMVYFLFSFEHRSKPVRGAARAGRWLLIVLCSKFVYAPIVKV
jgi:hypothetical protein